MLVKVPLTLRKWAWPKNENTGNLKSDSFVVIMLLLKVLTPKHSQKKPSLHYGEFHIKPSTWPC